MASVSPICRGYISQPTKQNSNATFKKLSPVHVSLTPLYYYVAVYLSDCL